MRNTLAYYSPYSTDNCVPRIETHPTKYFESDLFKLLFSNELLKYDNHYDGQNISKIDNTRKKGRIVGNTFLIHLNWH